MKRHVYYLGFMLICLIGCAGYSQATEEPEALGLPGDNLNLYAVLDIFQNSATIEKFEELLNSEDTKINNLDLNNDGKVDFIKVKTEKEGDNFMFVLQDELKENDQQDVAVIFVNKEKNNKISLEIVGDENLHGKNYVVEPNSLSDTSTTINPVYNGDEKVVKTRTQVSTVTIPVVSYLYSSVYWPYSTPYHYGYHPHYFRPWTPLYFNIYYRNHYHYYNNYHRPSYYPRHYTNYYPRRNTSVIVINNTRNGNYKNTYNGNTYRKPNNFAVAPSKKYLNSSKSSVSVKTSRSSTRRNRYIPDTKRTVKTVRHHNAKQL